ncbi:hypothetical protein SERLA73DRAFT_185621 [Serpula lacrymans var. lacrymans S7.3]|uniref:Piwi domain-containing protein n=2 Tax=Serpula lacrymans var. lacrymans TaxID=341189 RepID=F8Q649_SERL3|nr:hypothetical protein SERLA73DRAFT_185621 [Serpula lacrymans var. lacrymans S7.3]
MNQYQNNLALKINGKLGGINSGPTNEAMTQLAAKPTIVLGADVSHPAPGEGLRPSTTSLVSSCDARALQYVASVRIQRSRLEIIQDLREMVGRALTVFQTKTTVLPRRMFFYRDGVSEGELHRVINYEINAIGEAISKVYGAARSTWPALTFIVVGKRHHIRFFPQPQDAHTFSGNCQAGFVVDSDIVHPVHYDFYLQSHAGIKGTSRPSHYIVLRDDNGLNADALQELSYGLCHAYARATRSVSIPAPVYYADLVCRRAKFHYDPAWNFEDNVSVHSDDGPSLQSFQDHFSDISRSLENSMYFL